MKTICVYCGSSPGRDPRYLEAARNLGRALVERDIALVYGGAHIGVMGALADQMLALGGRVIGVIPERLKIPEVMHQGLTEIHITRSMHERKTLMATLADGFIALPGGIGTLEELFEIWTWAQLGFHDKPCALLNVAGYYDQLLAFLSHAGQEGFVSARHQSLMMIEQEVDPLLTRMADYPRQIQQILPLPQFDLAES